MVDSHSVFDVPLAVRVAERLEPYRLTWYEEPVAPVAPERIVETREIRRRIRQPMAGGEVLHGGGLLELTRIAAVAESGGVTVAPHNPIGPVSTAASIQACAVLSNLRLLELQWGDVP